MFKMLFESIFTLPTQATLLSVSEQRGACCTVPLQDLGSILMVPFVPSSIPELLDPKHPPQDLECSLHFVAQQK